MKLWCPCGRQLFPPKATAVMYRPYPWSEKNPVPLKDQTLWWYCDAACARQHRIGMAFGNPVEGMGCKFHNKFEPAPRTTCWDTERKPVGGSNMGTSLYRLPDGTLWGWSEEKGWRPHRDVDAWVNANMRG